MALISKYSLNGNANDLVWSNNWTALNVVWVDGKMNWWASLNWYTSYIEAIASNMTTFSVWFLFKPNAVASSITYTKIFSFSQNSWDTSAFDFSFDHVSNDYRQAFSVRNTSDVFFPCKMNTVMQANTRYYIVWTFDWTNIRVYVNGVYENISSNFSGTITTTWVLNIWRYQAWSQYWAGVVDEFETYNHVLTAAEIKNRYLYFNGFYNV